MCSQAQVLLLRRCHATLSRLEANTVLQAIMAKSYKGMNPTYFVGVQSVFKCTPADILDHQINEFNGKRLHAPSLHVTACTNSYVSQYYIMQQPSNSVL